LSAASPTLESLRREERAARYNLILDAAIRLFATRSFFDVGMREIADQAGISPALIYRHFSGQEALFLAVIDRECGKLLDRLAPLAERQGGPSATALAEGYLDFMAEHTAFFQMMMHYAIAGRLSGAGCERLEEHKRSVGEIFRDTMAGHEDAMTRGAALKAALDGILLSAREVTPSEAADWPDAKSREMARIVAERLAG